MSEGGFDYQAFQKQVRGSDPDRALIVTFEPHAVKQVDGSFKNVDFVRIWLSNTDEVVRPVTDADKVRFRDRWEAYQRNETPPAEGTPIAQCAFATPADVAGCKADRIYTLEQLVETPDERLKRSGLLTFKYRCRDWLEAQRRHGYVGELRDQIEALKAQIESLKEQNAQLKSEDDEPKKRGRKVRDAEDAA